MRFCHAKGEMMRYLKVFGLAAVLGAALMASAGTASANPLTSPEGTPYTSTLKAESSNFELHGNFVTVKCSSSFEGKVESHSSTTAGGNLSSFTLSGCNYPVEVKKPGSLEVHATGSGNATVTWSGAEISVATSGPTCVFTTSGTDIGTLTGSNATNATIDISGSLPRTGGSYLCGSTGTITGSYKVTTPSTLYVDTPSPLTSPEGTPYTSTLKAESSNFELHGNFVTVKCSSSFEGKVESHSSTTAGGNLSSFTLSGCNYPVEVKKPGSLEVHATGSGNATVTWSGAEISVATSGPTCVFTTSGTDIGTLTGSNATNATIDISGSLPRTGGSYLCGSTGTITGSYKVTTPSTLYVDS